ncbi:MAG TPA: AMP-binding protein [Myxococcota bacterium]|nr:AMP-binding protein [Myxococcota bacterium]
MTVGQREESGRELSIVRGIPLSEEPGLGTLTLPGFLREVTRRYAPREALVMQTPEGPERWSYADLWQRSVEVAKALCACGIGKDERVGILMTNRAEWIAAAFGTTLAGGVAVALSTFSTAPELDHMLQSSGVSVLLFEDRVLGKRFSDMLCDLEPAIRRAHPGKLESTRFPFLRVLAAVGSEVGGATLRWSDFLALGKEVPDALVEARSATTRPSDAAVVFFSSGSTSKAKGILSCHRGVAIQLWRFARLYRFEGAVRCWVANGFFWSGNFAMSIGGSFSTGGSIVLQPTFQAAEALELMAAEKVNFPFAWPHQWAQLEEAPNWKSVDLRAMRYVDRACRLARHPTVSTTWTEPNYAYGNTETFTISTAYPACTSDEVVAGSHGEVLPGNTVKIVDPLTGAVLPRGERGEIAVKGPTLMLGYLGVPIDETLDAEGFFRTGDGGYLDAAGRLFWEGRLTDIIKTGGANVSPLEVDAVLATFPGVKLARTVGVPHETLGELVVACIVPHEGSVLDETSIRDYLKERLASYKVPRRVLYFADAELSLTGSAKIKTGDLRKLAAERLDAAPHA